jgi:Enoyl-CoA hydratase/isomerase
VIVAADTARFGLPEVRRGQVAGGGGAVRLPHRIPFHVAAEMLLVGEPIPAPRAAGLGLVSAVVAHADLVTATLEIARKIASNAPLAVQATKKLLYATLDWPGAEAIRLQEPVVDAVRTSQDAAEGALDRESMTIVCSFPAVHSSVGGMVATNPKEEVFGYFDTLSNWRRWGEDEQLGTLNLITPAKRTAAAKLIQAGAIVTMAHILDPKNGDRLNRGSVLQCHIWTGDGKVPPESRRLLAQAHGHLKLQAAPESTSDTSHTDLMRTWTRFLTQCGTRSG